MPCHTAEAPCHSWKSVTETSRFTRPFHQTSRFAGFVYTNDSRATVLGGAGVPKRVGYRASPTNVPAPAEALAIALALTQSRRAHRLDPPAVFAPHGEPFSSLPIACAIPVLELRVRIERARAARPSRRHCASLCLQQSAPVDEPPEHEEHAESLQDREEQEESPDAADSRASDEHGGKQELQAEERPQYPEGRVLGSVERQQPEGPPDEEESDT